MSSSSSSSSSRVHPGVFGLLISGLLLVTSLGAERFHDPSTVLHAKGEYWIFSTGPGVKSWHSKDLAAWEPGPRIIEKLPAWASDVAPGNKGYFWAPDCIQVKGRYLLYYSISAWGKNTSAIGLVSNRSLDPADADYKWVDEGMVIQSTVQDDFNAIDPGLLLDSQGRLWMTFGSFWSGIKLVELDPATGRRIKPDSRIYSLARHSEIEAPCLVAHQGLYYLFVNWGACCRGVKSTYEIRVGRSNRVTGPYLDRDGKDLLTDGGTLLMGTEGRRIGPGHASVLREGKDEWFGFHFYDGERGGAATLGIRRLGWDKTGWPTLGEYVNPVVNH